jgi:hypothetical protein
MAAPGGELDVHGLASRVGGLKPGGKQLPPTYGPNIPRYQHPFPIVDKNEWGGRGGRARTVDGLCFFTTKSVHERRAPALGCLRITRKPLKHSI